MRKERWNLVLGLGLILATALGCNFSFNTNNKNNSNNSNNSNNANNANNTNGSRNSKRSTSSDTSEGAGSPYITSSKLSTDKTGSTEKSTYGTKEDIFAVLKIEDMPGDSKLGGRLVYDEVEGETSGSMVVEKTLDIPSEGGNGTAHFQFTPPPKGWPEGTYKVEIRFAPKGEEAKVVKTLKLTVE